MFYYDTISNIIKESDSMIHIESEAYNTLYNTYKEDIDAGYARINYDTRTKLLYIQQPKFYALVNDIEGVVTLGFAFEDGAEDMIANYATAKEITKETYFNLVNKQKEGYIIYIKLESDGRNIKWVLPGEGEYFDKRTLELKKDTRFDKDALNEIELRKLLSRDFARELKELGIKVNKNEKVYFVPFNDDALMDIVFNSVLPEVLTEIEAFTYDGDILEKVKLTGLSKEELIKIILSVKKYKEYLGQAVDIYRNKMRREFHLLSDNIPKIHKLALTDIIGIIEELTQ